MALVSNPADVKISIEKKFKQKPKVAELTTIEKPGKPMEEFKEKKQKSAPKAPKKTGNAILIITEKPQAALKIASALGDARKYSENKVPFYELTRNGRKILVASAVGHLFNLTYSKGQTGWPIFKTEWVPSFLQKSASFTKNYYSVLKTLATQASEFIVATDYDIEGEVIGWNVLRFIARQDDAKRMKYSTLTKDELVKAFENPLPTLDWGQAYAGETRHILDWLYGINLSRALMSAIKKAGSFRILSIGRVQGPALKIIVDRDREINSFKSEPYWQVLAHSHKTPFKHPKDIFNQEELEPFKDIKEALAETTEKEELIQPPHPFDLTTLQREAFAHHKFTPSRTLQIAQSLYLDGIISYPRTSSQKIPKEIEPKKILEKLKKQFPQAAKATRSQPIEGKKSDPAHPSIYPTGDFKRLEEDEAKLYDLIVRRFISCFAPDAKTLNKRVVLTADNGKNFTASGLAILENGWADVYPANFEESSVPTLNGKVKVDKIEFLSKETQPPKRYTAASLVTLLEKKNLGTKATRSIIIDTLFDRGYLDGKSIQATPLGMKLIEALEKHSPVIIDENLTRELEEKMEEILDSKSGFIEKERQVITSAEKMIENISKDFRANEEKIGQSLVEGNLELREQQKEQSIIMPCPVCKVGNISIRFSKQSRRYFAACDKYPDCKTTYSLPPNSLIKTTGKVSERNLPLLIAIRKGKRPWEFEFNPNWKAEQESQKNKEE